MAVAKAALFDARRFDAALADTDTPLPLFREALKAGHAVLKAAHDAGAGGAEIVRARAWLVDELLRRAWAWHRARLAAGETLALAAVGGYGRGELAPASDVDLMILTDRRRPERLAGFVRPLLQFLWDMGLEVGHSLRNPKSSAAEARRDITVATNIMEARLLAGDRGLFEAMRARTAPPRVWPSRAFFQAKWQEQIARHHRFHDTAYNLEPHVKEGPGGLRDIQMIGWVAMRHFGTGDLHELVTHGFLTEREYRALIRGRNFLWRVRNGLHFLTGRREDRLLFDHQRALAAAFGYRDRPGRLAVERFMKRYYRTIKALALLNELLLQHFQEELLARRRPRRRDLNRRFRAHGDFLELRHPRVFERQPFAMLELFLILQQHPELKGVRAATLRALQANLHRIDAGFRRDIACRSLFMEILRQPRGITHTLRRMNAYGVLGAYLPAFGRIVGQMQHDLFHVYTVDEHCLFVLRNIRRLMVPDYHHEFPFESALIQDLVKPERLYIAALFHDIAKGRGGDHSELGEREALAFCRRHDLSEYDSRFVAWLVRHHLVMSWTAQREDIDDPEVVMAFARQVGDQERLDNLYLLTVADIRGTGPEVWNAWKGRLLAQLYASASQIFRRGFSDPLRREDRARAVQAEALARLGADAGAAARRLWQTLGTDYFSRYDGEAVAWHSRRLLAAGLSDLPVVAARRHPEHQGIEILVVGPDRPDLFATLTGGIDRLGFDIVDARLHTTRQGLALDTFVVLDRSGVTGGMTDETAEIEAALRDQLLAPRAGRDPRSIALPRTLKQFPLPTRVQFAPAHGGQSTCMEVSSQDRPGLLYQIALALSACGVQVRSAKISTYGERAEDIFFLSRPGGGGLAAEQQDCLRAEILNRLAPAAGRAPEVVSIR